MDEQYKNILVRMPEWLARDLSALAARHDRSRNGQIVAMLKEAVYDARSVSAPHYNDEDIPDEH